MMAYFTFVLFYFLFLVSCEYPEFPNLPKTKCKIRECADVPPEFTYGDSATGPDNWPIMYKECGGRNQSPINLDMSNLATTKVGPLQWSSAYFNTPKSMSLTNNNHTVSLTATFPEDCQPKISGGCLRQAYFFSSIHFHWGSRDSKGSEHTIDEFAYPMEMHVIHNAGNSKDKTSSSNDLVVLAYFFEVSEKECGVINTLVEVLVKALKHPFKPIKIKNPFHLAALVQPFSSEYATYKGSLTTPPCKEGVRWIVYPYPLEISKKQMEKFRMACKYAPALVNNYRPVQPVNGRKVYFVT